jgi:hypothetical protein
MAKIEISKAEMDELLVEIITGKRLFQDTVSGEIFAVRFPTVQEKDRARIIYSKKYKELIASGLPTRKEMEGIIKEHEILPPSHFFFVKNLENSIEDMERSLKITNSEHQKASLKADIDRAQQSLYKLKREEELLYENSADMRAEDVRLSYLISACTIKGDELEQKYWESYSEYKGDTNSHFATLARQNFIRMFIGISAELIRLVARSYEWRNRWKASKQTGSPIFAGASADWDKNKVSICYWSDFYDTIFEYSTPPPPEVIEDDEQLFDWIREVNRINAQEANKSQAASQGKGKQKKVNSPYRIRQKSKGNFDKA